MAELTKLMKQVTKSNLGISTKSKNSEANFAMSLSSSCFSIQWILDSGVNHHMTRNLSLLHN